MKKVVPGSPWLRQVIAALRHAWRSKPGSSQRDFVRLGLTRLEDRVVLDAAGVVADVNAGVLGSSPAELTPFNGNLYFSASGTNANAQSVGRELYQFDGGGNVRLIADINPGAGDSNPSGFTPFNGSLIFAAAGPQGRELYRLDAAGNVTLFANVNPGAASSSPQSLTPFNNNLYFTAEVNHGRELYVATANGSASLVADLRPGSTGSNPSDFVTFNGDLFFAATGPNIRGLYKINGTGNPAPTSVNLGSGVTDPREFKEYDGRLYFSAVHPQDGRELFLMHLYNNGNSEAVHRLAHFDNSSNGSSPGGFFVFQNDLYFAATTQIGRELFRLNSDDFDHFDHHGGPDRHYHTSDFDFREFNIAPGGQSSSPGGFANFNNTLYFAATVNGQRGLYRLSGNNVLAVALPGGVTLPTDIVLTSHSSGLYFAANGTTGRELYRLDAAGAVTLFDVNLGAGNSDPAEVVQFGGKTYFVGTTPDVGRELLVVHAGASSLRIDNGVLVFRDDVGNRDNRLVVSSDGARLRVVDQNGHTVTLLTSLAGVTGSGTSDISIPLASLAAVSSLSINTRGGNDSVTFDLSNNASALLARFATLSFDGGANSDRLRFVGSDGLTSTYTPDPTNTGVGTVVVSGAGVSSKFTFRDLEPVDFTGFAVAALVTPNTGTDNDVLTISNGKDSLQGAVDALIVAGTVGGTTIETAYFFGNALVVVDTTGGDDGVDRVTVHSANNSHANISLRIDTGTSGFSGQDGVDVNGGIALTGEFTVETTQLTINGPVATGGAISLIALHDVVLTSSGRLTSSGAPIRLIGDANGIFGGGIFMADGSLIDAGSGTIALSATEDVVVGRLVTTNATSAAIAIASLAGRVLDGGDSGGANVAANGSGAVVTITADDGVGTSSKPLDLAVRQLVVATNNSDQYLREQDDLERLELIAGAGRVTLTAGGAIQDNDAAVDVQASAWTVQATAIGTPAARVQTNIDRLTATITTGSLYVTELSGDLRVAGVSAPGANAVVEIAVATGDLLLQIITASGANSLVVLQTPQGAIRDDNGSAVNLSAQRAELAAGNGIGTSNALETALARLTASGGSGGVLINNSGHLEAGPVTAAGAAIELSATGALTISDVVSTTASGAIRLAAGLDLLVQAALSTSAGVVELSAARSIFLASGVTISTHSGAISLLAGVNIVMGDGALLNSASGAIALQATGDITLGRLVTHNTTGAAISVSSAAGKVFDGGDQGGANLEANGAGAVVTVVSAGGVGTAGKALDIAARRLVVATTNTDQYLQEVDGLEQFQLTAGAGSISLIAGGSIQDSDAAVDVQAAAWTVQATTLGTLAARIQTNIGSLTAAVTGGGLYLTEVSGDLRVANIAAAGANAIVDVLVQTGALLLDLITASGTNSLVVLQTPQGAIRDLNSGAMNLIAQRAELSAAQGVGSGDALETSLAQFTAAGGSGGVFIHNSGDLETGLVTAADASIELTTSGVLIASGTILTTGSGAVQLASGSDLLLNAQISTDSGPVSITAGRDVTAAPTGDILTASGAVMLSAARLIFVADGATIASGSGAIDLQATGDVTLGRIVTGRTNSAAISVSSAAGKVLDGGDSGGANLAANGSGAVVTVTAAGGVGTAAQALDLAVRNLVVATTNTDQYLSELDALERFDLTAGTGHIVLAAGGAIEDIDAASDVQAAAWIVEAASIGTLALPIQTNIGALVATATAGGIFIANSGDLQIGPVSASGGSIALAADGTLEVAEVVQVTGNGAITLTAGSDLLVNAPLITTNGAIALAAGRDIVAIANADIHSSAGPVSLEASRAISLGTGTQIVTLSGAITLLANQGLVPTSGSFTGISLSGATITTTSGNVTLHGRSGAGFNDAGVELRPGSVITTDSGDIELVGVSRGTTGADGLRLSDASVRTLTTGIITVSGVGGAAGHGVLLLQNSDINALGAGDVLLAGTGSSGQTDIAWDQLTIGKSGGSYTFQDTVQGNVLGVLPGPYAVQFLDGGFIGDQVTFQNSGGVRLGDQVSDVLAIAGGATSIASLTTLQGTLATQGADIVVGTTRLVSQVALVTGGGDLRGGEVQGAGVALTIAAGGGQLTLTNPANVIGDLTIAAGRVQLVEQDDITQGGAWRTTGPTSLTALEHDITLLNAANVFGPLQLLASNIAIVAAAHTELQASDWEGSFDLHSEGDLSVTGALRGSEVITLAAQGDVRFTASGAIVAAANGADVNIFAEGAMALAGESTIASGTGTIALRATGDITLGRLVTSNSTAGALVVTSLEGSVLDGGHSGAVNLEANSAGAVATIHAASGVGAAGKAIQLAVGQLVVVTTNGDQFLHEQDALEQIELVAGAGRIVLTAGGAIHDSDADVDVQAAAWNVQAAAMGSASSPIQTNIGELTAFVTTESLFVAQVSGDLQVANIGAPSAIAVINIEVQSGNLLLDTISASGPLSLISLHTPQGAIFDSNGIALNLTSHRAELSAALGIGVGNALETSLDQLTAGGGSGGVFIANSGDLETGHLSATGANLAITTTGALIVAGAARTSGPGTIVFTAGLDVDLLAPLTTAAGAIELTSTRDLRGSAGGALTTESGAIRLAAGATLLWEGHIELGAGSVTFVIADAASQLRGSISGSGHVVKQGAGTLTIAAASFNTYTGTTELTGGTLTVDGVIGTESPAGRFTLAAGTVLRGSGIVNAPIHSVAPSATISPSGNLRLGDGSPVGFDFAGQLVVGAVQVVTLRDADLAQLGALTSITGGGKLVAAGGVEVGAGDNLAGSGAVAGNIVVRPGGIVSPGSSPGVLATDVGDLTLFPNATLVLQVNGTTPGEQYDQINVRGSVALEGSILSLQGGLFRPALGTVFTLVANDGADPIQGRFIDTNGAALGEGATVRFGGIEAELSYFGGPGGNSVTLTVQDRITIVQTQSTSTNVPVIGDRAQMQDVNFLLARSIASPPTIVFDSPLPAIVSTHGETRAASLELRQAERIRVFFRIVNGATEKDEPKQYELDPLVLRDVLGFFKRYKFPDNHYRIYLQEPGKKERLILDVHVVDGRIVPPNFRETENPGALPNKNPAPDGQPAPPPEKLEAPQPNRNAAAPAADGAQASWQVRVREALADDYVPLDKVARMLRSAR